MISDLLRKRGHELKPKGGGEYSAACPWCGGKDRFCVWPEKDRYWCRQCDAKGDSIQLLRDLDGLSFQEAKEALGRGDNGGGPQKRPTKKKEAAKPKAGKVPFVHPELGKPDSLWKYTDEAGKPLFCVARFNQNGNGKAIRQCKADGLSWSVKGIRPVLYDLPSIMRAHDVWMVEGEKCVDILTSLGFGPVTTSPGGAGKWPKLEEAHGIGKPLHGKKVFFLPDNDSPGREHAEDAARSLHGKAEVFILELPGLPEKGDVADYLEEHGPDKTAADLVALADKAKPWKPPSNFFTAEDLLDRSFERNPPIIGNGILPYGGHGLISGEAGVGKSLLRMELSLHLIMGWEWLGFPVLTARRIAVFQFENTEAMEQTRLRRMCEGLGISGLPRGSLRYIDRKNRLDLTTKRDRGKLEELVGESEAEVIIYDCLSNLHSSDENKNIAMREVLDSLTEVNSKCGTSCILIHHFGKPSEGQANRYRTRGAQSIIDWAVTAAGFMAKHHESRVLRTLEFFKVRDGAMPKPLLLERDENFLLTRIEEDTLCPPGKVREILEDLGGEVEKQRALIDAITEEAGCSPRSAQTFIRRAVEMKAIIEKAKGQGHAKGYQVSM